MVTVVPGAANAVHVAVTGGSIVVLDNADLSDHDPYRTDQRRAFNGRGLAILRPAGAGGGPLRVTARADGLRDGTLTLIVH